MTELVVRGGLVVDGTGAPAYHADVAVTGGRIEAIGRGLRGGRALDAAGMAVAPGFFDLHTHYDAQVLWDPLLTPSAFHGVTSVVAGNCGFTLAPCRPSDHELVLRTLERVEDMPYASLSAGVDWGFESYGEYLRAIARRGTAINFGGYVGHTAVRLAVLGAEAYERAATEAEIGTMAHAVAVAVTEGALGFSTSNLGLHRGWKGKPVPSNLATREEIVALMRAAAGAGATVVQMAPQGDDVEWLYELQPSLGCNLTWSALLVYPGPRDYRTRRDALRRGRAVSERVWAQVTCRPVTAELTMAEPVAYFVVPAFSDISALDRAGRSRAYADPSWRARAWDELESHAYNDPLWDEVRVVASVTSPGAAGRRLVDVASERGTTPLEAMLDLSLADGLATRFHVTVANSDEAAVSELLTEPGCVLGLSDAGAHVGQLCDAVLPTDLLGSWVRERQVLSLEEGVHKLTGELAGLVGIGDRGVLRPGAAADLVVFDPETVAPGPVRRTADMPGGAERLLGDRPVGIAHVVVNGVPLCVDGTWPDPGAAPRPGALLRPAPVPA